jgi:hypothetical protein
MADVLSHDPGEDSGGLTRADRRRITLEHFAAGPRPRSSDLRVRHLRGCFGLVPQYEPAPASSTAPSVVVETLPPGGRGSDGADGLRTAEITVAAVTSARERRTIPVHRHPV